MERVQICPSVDNIGNKKAENNQNDQSRRAIKAHEGAGAGKAEPLCCHCRLLKPFSRPGSLSHPYQKHLIFWFPCPVSKQPNHFAKDEQIMP